MIIKPLLLQQISSPAGRDHIHETEQYIMDLLCNITGYTPACAPNHGVYWPEWDFVLACGKYPPNRCFVEMKCCKGRSGSIEIGKIDSSGTVIYSGLTSTQSSVIIMINPTQDPKRGKVRVLRTKELVALYNKVCSTEPERFTTWPASGTDKKQTITMSFNFNELDDLCLLEMDYNAAAHEFDFNTNSIKVHSFASAHYRQWFEETLR